MQNVYIYNFFFFKEKETFIVFMGILSVQVISP